MSIQDILRDSEVQEKNNSQFIYVKFLSSLGTFASKAEEGDKGAVERSYEDRRTGKSGTKWEYHFILLSGTIIGASYIEADNGFGASYSITIRTKRDVDVNLSISASSQAGRIFAEKMVNLDLSGDIELKAYAPYVPKNGTKEVNSGISIKENGVKVQSKYMVFDSDSGKVVVTDDRYPSIDWDKYNSFKTDKDKKRYLEDHNDEVDSVILKDYLEFIERIADKEAKNPAPKPEAVEAAKEPFEPSDKPEFKGVSKNDPELEAKVKAREASKKGGKVKEAPKETDEIDLSDIGVNLDF